MKTLCLLLLNVALLGLFIFIRRRPNSLSYFKEGRIWLTWPAVAVITLMDELTSVSYAPTEAFRFIGPSAVIFIVFARNHFRPVMIKRTGHQHIVALLKVPEFEFPHRRINVHLGWPLSSWIDRLSIGVMVFNIMRLPKLLENLRFTIHYSGRPCKRKT